LENSFISMVGSAGMSDLLDTMFACKGSLAVITGKGPTDG
jgi:hypothetical protein